MKTSHLALLGVAAVIAIAVLAVPEAQQLALSLFADPIVATGAILAHAVPGAAVVSSNHMRGLQQKKAKAVARMREISAAAGENQFTADQQEEYSKLRAARDLLDDQITREADLVASEAQLGIATLPNGAITVTENAANDPKMGFKAFGEFARAVLLGSVVNRNGGKLDPRLMFGDVHEDGRFQAAAPTTFGNELAGVDGGFLIPPQFANDIFMLSLGEDSFLPYTDNVDLDDGNGMVFPKDETTPWGTDGIRAYWQAEAGAGTQTKPKLGTLALRLHKLMALVPVTDELLSDSRALAGYLPKKVASSIRWKTNEAIINGTGAGQPQGMMSSAAVTQVSKDSGQATLTLTILNLANMMAQLPNGSWGSAIWLIHNTVLGALFTLNSSGFPYYLPFGAGQGPLAKSPFGSLLGRPVIVSQHAAAFTSAGDVQLHDFQYYQTITKGGMQTATSMHLYFDADAAAFRTTFRIDGKPKIAAAITQNVGTPKLSPFLKLQAR
jgi:HK97 family phage major capsid protein